MASVSTDQVNRPRIEPTMPQLTAADLAALPDELPSGPVKYELDNGKLVVESRLEGLTAADVAVLPEELPSGPIDYELDNGSLIMMSPASDWHSEIQAAFASELRVQGQKRGLGKAYVEVGLILWKDPFRVVAPDAAFVAKSSLPIARSPEGYLETIPDLVVEARSKNDTLPFLERKVADDLHAGVRLVWLADGDSETVTEFRPDQKPKTYAVSDTLECDDVIPNFRLTLAELFQE